MAGSSQNVGENIKNENDSENGWSYPDGGLCGR